MDGRDIRAGGAVESYRRVAFLAASYRALCGHRRPCRARGGVGRTMTGPLQIVLGTVSVLFLVVAVVYATRAVRAMIRIIRTGQPDDSRRGPFAERIKALAIESLGHTRMLKWSAIGVAHWFVFVGFYGLFLTLVQAFGEVWNPGWELPIIGHL